MKNHIFNKIQLTSYFVADVDNDLSLKISGTSEVCASCRDYVNNLKNEKIVFLQTLPYNEIALPQKDAQNTRLVFHKTPKFYSLAASLLVFIAAGYFFLQHTEPASRIKGEEGLKLFVKNGNGAVEKRGEQRYFPGEKVQFLYSCGSQNKFMLLSVDTSGTISQYYPAQGDSSIALEPGQDAPLPHSILLDKYIGKESYRIFSEKPLNCPSIKKIVKVLV